MENTHYVAVLLAAGKGSRMNSETPKQYMSIKGKPVLYYSLKEFEESAVNEIIIVVGAGEEELCRERVVKKYGFSKVTSIIAGGRERYLSVYRALCLLRQREGMESCYVMIHDAARPLISKAVIAKTMREVVKHQAVVVAVPTKDTIKVTDETGKVISTPIRSNTYIVQTPQAFSYGILMDSYERVMEDKVDSITDDAMVVEYGSNHPVQVIIGEYRNIKITTPEDIAIVENLMENEMDKSRE